MNDDRIERLLRGYRIPDAPEAIDPRVLAAAERMFARARMRAAAAGIARELGNALGFGYVSCLIDLVTTTDAEYRVDLI
jgi:hypothetical protein